MNNIEALHTNNARITGHFVVTPAEFESACPPILMADNPQPCLIEVCRESRWAIRHETTQIEIPKYIWAL
jgi:hypothetical protein